MTTATTLIGDAMKSLGVLAAGQSPSSSDLSDCLRRLNNMLASWSNSTLLVPFRTSISKTLTGASSYTIGSGGDIDTTRPTAISSAYTRLNGIDYPVRVSRDRAEYDRICQKALIDWPGFLYYEPTVPLGTLYVWPVGDATYTLYLTVQGQLTAFPDATTDVDLAPGYDLMIHSNLALQIAPMYETQASSELTKTARDSMTQIKRINRQSPVMEYDQAIPGAVGGYNIEVG